MIDVGVIGASGRMGSEVCKAVAADPEVRLVAAVDPVAAGTEIQGVRVADSLAALGEAGATVAVDFTGPDIVMGSIRGCLEQGIHVVVGTTGISAAQIDEIRGLAANSKANVIVAPNFSIGAVLMMKFAEEAAAHFDGAEIVELHHDGKADAPSGTAIATARRIAAAQPAGTPPAVGGDAANPGARGADIDGVRVHAVRLPGLLAHQEVIFGTHGDTLSIRHDTTDRASFMPGVLLAVKAVADRPGLTVGIETLLGL